MRSFFYIDEEEFDLICNQVMDNVVSISSKEIKDGNIECNIEFGSLFKKFIPGFNVGGILKETEEKCTNRMVTIEDRILFIIQEIEKFGTITSENAKDIQDGEIVIIEGGFVLDKIITEDRIFSNFDTIENLDYILARLPEQSILVFECNSLSIQNPIEALPVFQVKMHCKKIKKSIHHYADKISEYVSWNFSIMGEMSLSKNKIIINPIVVWR